MALRTVGKVAHVVAVITGLHSHRGRSIRFNLLRERVRLMAQITFHNVGRIMRDVDVRVDRIAVLTQRLDILADEVFEWPVTDQAIHGSEQ